MNTLQQLQRLLNVNRTVKRIGTVRHIAKGTVYVTVGGKPEQLPYINPDTKAGDRVVIQDGVATSIIVRKNRVPVYRV